MPTARAKTSRPAGFSSFQKVAKSMDRECTETINNVQAPFIIPDIYCFGKGARNTRMDVYSSRRAHLAALDAQVSDRKALVELLGRDSSQISQLLGKKTMGAGLAREFEARAGHPRGSWDIPMDDAVSKTFSDPSKVYVRRVVGLRISAGTGELIHDFEEIDNRRAFDREWMQEEGLESAHCKLIDVKGDSMSPTLEDGETILVNTRERQKISGKVYALIGEDGIRVKRLLQRADNQWEIHSDNQMKHLYPTEAFAEGKVAIWGRVRWHAGTM